MAFENLMLRFDGEVIDHGCDRTTERCAANLDGVLSCYDRLIVTDTLPGACYAGRMTGLLHAHGMPTGKPSTRPQGMLIAG